MRIAWTWFVPTTHCDWFLSSYSGNMTDNGKRAIYPTIESTNSQSAVGTQPSASSIFGPDGKLSSASKLMSFVYVAHHLTCVSHRCSNFTQICQSSRPPVVPFNRWSSDVICRGCSQHSGKQQKIVRALEARTHTCRQQGCVSCKGP